MEITAGSHTRATGGGALALAVLMWVGAGAPVLAQTCVPESTSPGSLDTCFGVNGSVTVDVTGSVAFQTLTSVTVLPDQRIVATGYGRSPGTTGTAGFLMRFEPDGSPDASFGVGGLVWFNVSASTADTERASALAVQSDGKLIVAAQAPLESRGNPLYGFAVLRYHTNGTLDTTFGTSGLVHFNLAKNTDAWARTVALQPDGKIVVAGSSGSGSTNIAALARLTPAGALDVSFGTGGKVTVSFGKNVATSVAAVTVDGSGRIVAAGGVAADAFVMRFMPNGTLDTSFDGDGKVRTDVAGFANYLNAVTIDASGRIVGAGRGDLNPSANGATELWLVRYTTAGALDSSFGTGGSVLLDVNGTIDIANALAIQGDGRIVIAADAEMPDYSFGHSVLARINVNGSLDDGSIDDATPGDVFGTSGMTLIDFLAPNDNARGLALQPDNDGAKIIVGSALNGSRLIALTRFYQ